MSVDFVARALARQQQSGQTQSFTTLATAIPGVQIPVAVKVMQTSGYAAEGLGAGTYVNDPLATSALATAHPRFCKADSGGRYWRLLSDDNNLVPVSCGGADGSALSTDDRAAIQAAIDYAEAIGATGTRYDATDYLLRRTSRTLTAPNDIHADKSGLLLQTTKSHRFISACGGTTLWRRDTDGSAMGVAKFDTCTGSGGYYWRGGGIFVEGQTTAPSDVSENSIYLYDMILDGGITDSSEQNNPYGANMHSSGDGWDNSDKGIWQSNDRYCGNIVLEGRSGIRYFMGELIYSSGSAGDGIADREIRIGPDVELGHTCGSCLNGNGHTLKVERCRLHNAYMGIEGWTGHLGGYIKAVISDCSRNSLQGGTPNFGAGSFYQKTRPIATVVPVGHVDLVLNKAGSFEIGSWISGTIEAFDCYPNLGNTTAFSTGSKEVDLHIITWADQGNVLAGVGLLGGGSGAMTTDKVSVRVDCKRTDNAVTNGYRVLNVAYSYGSFGPDVCVWVGATTAASYSAGLINISGAMYDNAIKVLGWNCRADASTSSYNIEANNNGTISVISGGCAISLSCTNNGSYTTNLPTTGTPPGYRLFLLNFTNNYVSGGAACRIPAGNFRNGGDLIIPPGYSYAELEFDGQKWSVVTQPPALGASITWDPGSVAAGASVTTTIPAIGAVVGDAVRVGFSNNLQGLLLTGYVSAANTITVVLANLTGSAVDLASGTLRVTLG